MSSGLDHNHKVNGRRVRLESGRIALWVRHAIRTDHAEGACYRELMKRYQIAEEGIRRILREEGPSPMRRRSRWKKVSHALKNREKA